MGTHHLHLLSTFFVFLVGMIVGTALARNPMLWISVIILVALIIGLMGMVMKPKKKRKRSRSVKPHNLELVK